MKLGLGLSLNGTKGPLGPSLAAGISHRYDFSDNANLTLSTNDITSVDDIGELGTATLSGASGQYPTNTGSIGGVQAALFDDATSDMLKATSGLDASLNDTAPPITVAVVFQCSRPNLNMSIVGLYGSGADSDPRIFVGLNTAGTYECYIRDESVNVAPTVRTFGTRDTAAHVMTMTLAGDGTMNIWLDGVLGLEDADASTAGTRFVDQIGIGCMPTNGDSESFYFEGSIGEVLVYPEALTPAQVVSNDATLMAKWGIT